MAHQAHQRSARPRRRSSISGLFSRTTTTEHQAWTGGPDSGPQQFGRYILLERLGAGGMAEVFRAVVIGPQEFQRVVVVKRILPRLCADPAFVKMFIDEATLCGRLSHPNIIQVHEFGEAEDQHFIAMEYVHGRSLSQVLRRLAERRQPLPFTIAAEVMRQVCRGLAYAHTLTSADGRPLGIVHRDVSPGNIIVGYTGAVKLLDFGIARVEDRFRLGNTQPGQVKGKSAYLAPEQVTSQAVDHRADVFAAGILLFEMVTGRRLFKGSNPLESMNLVTSLPIPVPSQLEPKIPPRLEAIVLRALRRPREERYQSASDMADDLESFLLQRQCGNRDLPRFMSSLFQEESGRHLTQLTREELRLLHGGRTGAHGPTVDVTSELPPPTRSSGALPALSITNTSRMWRPVGGRPGLRLAGAALGLLLLGFGARQVLRNDPPGGRSSVAPVTLAAASLPAGTAANEPPARSARPRGAEVTPIATERAEPRRLPRARATSLPTPTTPPTVTLTIDSDPSGALVLEPGTHRPLGVTPLILTRRAQSERLSFRILKEGHVDGVLQVVPDADKPASLTLAPLGKGIGAPVRRRSNAQKVRHALPINPFDR